jgi:uncharacterized membrane protein YozB (DUF420 family)
MRGFNRRRCREITVSDLNLVLQIVIFIIFLTGIFFIKRKKKNLEKHRLLMATAILINFVSIFTVMGKSFLIHFGLLIERFYDFGPLITWIHAIVGGLAMIMGIGFLFRHPGKIVLNMRIAAVLWAIALILGIVFYIYNFVVPH